MTSAERLIQSIFAQRSANGYTTTLGNSEIKVYKKIGCAACDYVTKQLQRKRINYESFTIGEDLSLEGFKHFYPYAEFMPTITVDGNEVSYNDFIERIK